MARKPALNVEIAAALYKKVPLRIVRSEGLGTRRTLSAIGSVKVLSPHGRGHNVG